VEPLRTRRYKEKRAKHSFWDELSTAMATHRQFAICEKMAMGNLKLQR